MKFSFTLKGTLRGGEGREVGSEFVGEGMGRITEGEKTREVTERKKEEERGRKTKTNVEKQYCMLSLPTVPPPTVFLSCVVYVFGFVFLIPNICAIVTRVSR